MSRTPQEKRLHLFGLGNDRCPICLTGFKEADVRAGEAVELEHVPAKSLNAGGFAMCLTCADCNNSASKMEKVAAEMDRALDHGWKAQLTMAKGGIPPQTVYVTGDGPIANIKEYLDIGKTGPIRVRSKGLRVSEEEFSQALLRPDQTLRLQYSFDERYASVAWLKAAYLSVFSLLGKYGYRYAQGEAIERVRGQIMEPNREILRPFHFAVPPEWKHGNGVGISRKPRPCWVIKMKDRLVVLPRGWDTSFYEWVESAMSGQGKLTLGGGPLWNPYKFGHVGSGSGSFIEGRGRDPRQDGADLFGMAGRMNLEDGRSITILYVDHTMKHVTVVMAPHESAPV